MNVRVNGQLIKELRVKHSYSQEKLAEIVGVNLRTIQRIEANGVAALSTRGALARAFGVKPEELEPREAVGLSSHPGGPADRGHLLLLLLAIALVVLGATILARSIVSVAPIGLVTLPAVGGFLVALVGLVMVSRLTPLPRRRIYAVLGILAVSMIASPPAWMLQALLIVALWAVFELGVLVTTLRPPMRRS